MIYFSKKHSGIRILPASSTVGRFVISGNRGNRKVEIWAAAILVCGLAGALGAAAVSVPFWLGGGLGLLASGYLVLQINFETPSNRDFVRAQRGEKDESAGSELHHGRHRSSGDFPGHMGGSSGGLL